MSKLRFALLGEGTLPLQCAGLLLELGHRLVCVQTSDAHLARWAAGQGIGSDLSLEPFDYLLSIVNPRILSAEHLALPLRGALNYHDAPLPRLAGTYATSWAILEGQTEHGITWHKMESRVDAGDILLQRLFRLAPDETAFTLNARCYQAALDSFPELIAGLAEGSLTPRSQDLSLRTFYPADRRPPVLDWNRPAEEISALVRALDFGIAANPLGAARIFLDDVGYIVPALEVLALPSTAPPGTILPDEYLRIATGSRDVRISRLLTLTGEPALARGLRLGPVAADRADIYWQRRLATMDLFRMDLEGGEAARASVGSGELLAFLSRITEQIAFDVWVAAEPAAEGPWLSLMIPVRIQISPDETVEQAIRGCDARIEEARRHGTFGLDLLARTPATRGHGPVPKVQLYAGPTLWLDDGSCTGPTNLLESLEIFRECQPDTPLWQAPLTRVAPFAAEPLETGSLVEAFERQVERIPANIAVDGYTYQALNREANRLARSLQEEGVGPGDRVGLLLDRSPAFVSSMLAILKVGAAYVPLDPTYPAERLAWMAQDARLSMTITADFLARVGDTDCGNLDVPIAGEEMANLMYTSGSTGTPKGVCIPHRGIVTMALNVWTLREDDVVLQISPLSFDASTLEIWSSLLQGARLRLAPAYPLSLHELAELFEGVTTAFLTAPLFHQMMEGPLRRVTGLRNLMAGGDVLSPVHAAEAARLWPGAFRNGYGPTECSAVSCTYRCLPETQPRLPIGKPIRGTRCYVLDARGQAVPQGLAGELWIGGAGVGLGYWDRPQLTREKFRQDPAKGLMYRTGDRVRILASGDLEFLGRLDSQVKISGHRVEPGEVEAALRRHSKVRECAVAVANKRLIAYVETELTPHELREFLRGTLPVYLIPSVVHCVARLPLGPSGKLDRSSLPDVLGAADSVRALWSSVLGTDEEGNFFDLGGNSLDAMRLLGALSERYGVNVKLHRFFREPTLGGLERLLEAPEAQAPASPAASRTERSPVAETLSPEQEEIRRVWAEVLELESATLGSQENFFDLGGNSLAALRILARLERDVSLRRFLENPTIGALALCPARIRQESTQRVEALDAPASYPQESLWLAHRLDPLSPAYNSCFTLRFHGPVRVPALRAAVERLLERHEALRTRFQEIDGQVCQVISKATLAWTEDVDLLACARRPFDLASGNLLRAAFSQDRLLLCFHHIAFDGWSLPVFVRELAQLYNGTGALSVLPLQYRDFALQQRSAPLSTKYWENQLRGAPALSTLPPDWHRPFQQGFAGAVCSQPWPEGLDLDGFARTRRVTLFVTLLAIFTRFVAGLMGQEEVVVATPVAGRTRPELEGLVGYFVSLVALRCRPSADTPAYLAELSAVVAEAFDHQGVPWDRMLAAVRPVRYPGTPPLAQICFTLQEDPVLPPFGEQTPELEWVTTNTSKFDLSMFVQRSGGRLSSHIEYNTSLYSESTVRGWMQQWHQALESVGRSLEATQVLRGETRVLPTQTLASLFFAQPAESRALVSPPLSFGELQARVRGLAARLQELGAGPERHVGIWLEPGTEQIVAVLAVLCVGAAFVPLEPARLDWILAEADLAMVISDRAIDGLLCVSPTARGSEYFAPVVGPENLAYVLYTSGSSGRPKGVMGTVGGLLNRLHWAWETFPFGDGEIACAKTALSFVDSVAEILGPLLAGVPLLVVPAVERVDPGALWRQLAAHRVTRVVLVPSLLWAVLKAGGGGGSLRLCVSSGEVLTAELAAAFAKAFPEARLVNFYGSTEVAGDVAFYEVSGTPTRIPIGRPIWNTELHVLDDEGNRASEGVLWVGGASVARGYLGVEPGFGRFCTGDRVRLLEDGNLLYLGRADRQIKLRGVRIEEAEVEAALLALEGIEDAVVAVRGENLVAFYTGQEKDFRTALALRLPGPLIPTQFVRLAALPRTLTGKLDREALPHVTIVPGAGESDALESRLAELWQSALGVRPGPDDDFFALGGHSLRAVELFGRIERELGTRIPLASLFEAPTVRLQAAVLRRGGGFGCLVPMAGGEGPPIFLVHPLGGEILHYRELASCLRHPVVGLQARGLFGAPQCTIEEMADTYLRELRASYPEGPYVFAGLSLGGTVAFEMARQLGAPATVILIDSYAPGYRQLWTPLPHRGVIFAQRVLFHLEGLLRSGPSRCAAYWRQRTRSGLTSGNRATLEGCRNAALSYRGGRFEGEVYLLRARYQPPGCLDPTNGWKDLAPRLQVSTVPGIHGQVLVQAPYCVEPLAARIEEILQPFSRGRRP